MAVYMNMKFIYLHRIIITQICEYFVPGTGVEPARLLRAHGPKPCVYAISPPRLAFGEYAP